MNAPLPALVLAASEPHEPAAEIEGPLESAPAELIPDVASWTLARLVDTASELCHAGHLLAAAEIYRRWLQSEQTHGLAVAEFNYGALLQQLGRAREAQEAYARCIEVAPGMGQAYVNLGLTYERSGQISEALDVWGRCAALRLTHAGHDREMVCTALNHIGRVQEGQRRYDLAEAALRESLRLLPDQSGVIQHWVHVRQKACMWPIYVDLPGISRSRMLRCTSPLAMLALSDDPLMQLSTAQAFVQRTYQCEQARLHELRPRSSHHGRVRVGLISADLREHAVGFLLPQFLDAFDRKSVDLYAYDATREEDTALRRQLLARFTRVRPIGALDDKAAARLIAQDEVDVLIDLHGLSSGARPGILAQRPAPHQGTYLGYVGTTALPWVDFVLVDREVMTPEAAGHFTETPVLLDMPYIPLSQRPVPLDTASRDHERRLAGFSPEAFVMAAFGNVYKITPELFDVWLSLLDRIPKSVLWLLDDNPVTTRNLRQHAQLRGQDPARLVFASRIEHEAFRRRLALADVYLDTYPYNGGSTTNDVIDAGVPMVSRCGNTPVSRMGLSIMSAIGRADLVVASFQAYADKVVELWLTRSSRRALRTTQAPIGRHTGWLDLVLRGRIPDQVAPKDASSTTLPAASVQWVIGRVTVEDVAVRVVDQVLHAKPTAAYTGLWASEEVDTWLEANGWSPSEVEAALQCGSSSSADVIVLESQRPALAQCPHATLSNSAASPCFLATRRTWLLWLEAYRGDLCPPDWVQGLSPVLQVLNAAIHRNGLRVETRCPSSPDEAAWQAMALRQFHAGG